MKAVLKKPFIPPSKKDQAGYAAHANLADLVGKDGHWMSCPSGYIAGGWVEQNDDLREAYAEIYALRAETDQLKKNLDAVKKSRLSLIAIRAAQRVLFFANKTLNRIYAKASK